MNQAKEQRCEGRFCSIKEKCGRHVDTGQPERWLPVDYSLVPTFKPGNAVESCRMFLADEEVRL